MTTPTQIVEHVGGDFGATVVYTLPAEYNHYVEFFAAEIVGRGADDGAPDYVARGAMSSMDCVEDPLAAARYVSGSVKWDGCSHVNFGDDQGYLHVCGREGFDKLANILAQIYERCGELMQERGCNLLEGEFKCGPL